MEKLKVLSLFSGIGAFEKALSNLGVEHEVVGFSEIDRYASKSYQAIHGDIPALGDITKIDEKTLPKDIDLITYGFPCQDISRAGLQKGLFDAEGKSTRSGLFFDALRIIQATKPKIAIAENVKGLICDGMQEVFSIIMESLKGVGYSNYWFLLNAKHYGVPQNRERVFIISIRNDEDTLKLYSWNEETTRIPLTRFVKDLRETNVDKKYDLTPRMLEKIVTRLYENNEALKLMNLYDFDRSKSRFRVPQDNGIAPTLMCRSHLAIIENGGGFLIPSANKIGFEIAHDGDGVYLDRPHQKRGTVQKGMIPTLKCNNRDVGIIDGMRARRITPLEGFRLTGFEDSDFEKARPLMSDTQLYSQVGNSIVVQVAEMVLKKGLLATKSFTHLLEEDQISLFDFIGGYQNDD